MERTYNKKNPFILDANKQHYLLLIFLAFLMFVNFVLPNDYVALLASLVSIGYILTAKRKFVIPTAVFFAQFAYLMVFGNYNLYVFFMVATIVRCAIGEKRKIGNIVITCALYGITHLLSSDVFGLTIGNLIPLISLFSLFAICLTYKAEDKTGCIKHFLLSFLLSSVCGLFAAQTRLIDIINMDFMSFGGRMIQRFSGLSYDCNFYALSALMAVFIILVDYKFISNRRVNSLLRYILLFIVIAFGITTFSKSYVIGLAYLFVSVALFGSKRSKKSLRVLVPIAVIGLIVFSGAVDTVFSIFDMRLAETGTGINGLTTGRYALWLAYIDLIFSSSSKALFGYGINGPGYYKACHNVYLEIISKFGIIGFIIELIFMVWAFRKIRRKIQIFRLSDFGIVAVLFVFLLFNLSAYTFFALWMILFMVLISGQKEIGEGE